MAALSDSGICLEDLSTVSQRSNHSYLPALTTPPKRTQLCRLAISPLKYRCLYHGGKRDPFSSPVNRVIFGRPTNPKLYVVHKNRYLKKLLASQHRRTGFHQLDPGKSNCVNLKSVVILEQEAGFSVTSTLSETLNMSTDEECECFFFK